MTERCQICDSENLSSPIELRETMFGTGEKFLYERCSGCGCLQIIKQPVDIAKYYPDNYYAYAPEATGVVQTIKQRTRDILSLYGPA